MNKLEELDIFESCLIKLRAFEDQQRVIQQTSLKRNFELFQFWN